MTKLEQKEYNKQYYQDHKEEIKIYAENRKEKRAEYLKKNKNHTVKIQRKYRESHKNAEKEYKKLHKTEIRDYHIQYWKDNPAKYHWKGAQTRCLYDKESSYYMRIPFEITPAYVEKIWIRDNADQLLKPSIDRIENELGYVEGNIQFIELSENLSKKRGKYRLREVR